MQISITTLADVVKQAGVSTESITGIGLSGQMHVLLPKDYIRYILTGQYATDVSAAAGINYWT